MANIPVEKTGTNWLPWILGLLALALIGFFIFLAADDPDNDDDAILTEDVTPVVVDDLDPVAVDALDLSNLYVTRVTGDRTFFVAPSEAMQSDETLVILDQDASPGAPGIEGQVDINPGQMVSLSGGALGALGDMDLAGMGLSDDDANAMTPATEVIRVDGDNVSILSAPMGEETVEVD